MRAALSWSEVKILKIKEENSSCYGPNKQYPKIAKEKTVKLYIIM